MYNLDIWDDNSVLKSVHSIESYIASVRSHCANLADLNSQLSTAWASDSSDKKSYLANNEKNRENIMPQK